MSKRKNIFNKPAYLEMLNMYNIDVDYVYELYIKETKRQKELGNSPQVIKKYFDCFIETGDFSNIEDRIDKIRKLHKRGVTLERCVLMYGLKRGTEKFNEYREKQAHSNSQEYKNMSDEEFKEYNKSRAVTLENQIKKYGIEEGTKRFEEYRLRQSYTNSLDYFIEKYGPIDGSVNYKRTVFTMGHSIDSYEFRYGEEGLEKFELYMSNKTTNKGFHSNMASTFFESVVEGLDIDCDIYYAPNTRS